MNNTHRRHDQGSVLPLALVATVVMSMIVVSLARYTATDLKYGQIVEDRADRLSAAEAGLRHILEQEQEGNTLCTSSSGVSGTNGPTITDTISGASVDVKCKQVNGTLSSITAWAVFVTGEDPGAATGKVPNGQGLLTQGGNGDPKVFGGPSFVNDVELLGIGANLEMRDGNLWYEDPSCDVGGEYIGDGAAVANPLLTFSPSSRGVWCTNQQWDDIIDEPPIPNFALLPTDPVWTPSGTCRVFEPGIYTSAPDFGTNAYLQSGNYKFTSGEINITQSVVTAGLQGFFGDQQEIENAPCDAARQVEADGPSPDFGATFYLDNDARFVIDQQGSLEVLRRQQGATDFVSMQALPTSTVYHSTGNKILSTGPGSNKQMAMHGQVYTPNGSIVFGNVANSAVAQFSGGVVAAAFTAQSAANVSGFVIQVAGSPQQDDIAYTATATKNGITQVRVVAALRFSAPASGSGAGSWELALKSWRVCDGLC
jgi:Tfp pilus assembly protein PilV